MKNSIILTLLLVGFTLPACSQKDAPLNVKKVFAEKFAAAKSVKWVSEEADEWEAEFKLNGKEMTAAFDNEGKWLETETEITSKGLPAAVNATLNREFAGFKTEEISIVENPEMKGFEMALKNKEDEITVIIANDGSILKKETAGEDAEKGSEEKEEK